MKMCNIPNWVDVIIYTNIFKQSIFCCLKRPKNYVACNKICRCVGVTTYAVCYLPRNYQDY